MDFGPEPDAALVGTGADNPFETIEGPPHTKRILVVSTCTNS